MVPFLQFRMCPKLLDLTPTLWFGGDWIACHSFPDAPLGNSIDRVCLFMDGAGCFSWWIWKKMNLTVIYVNLLRSSASSGRPAEDLILNLLSFLNKVFRFQRKTLWLSYCFFFSIIKTYCYSIVSFSLLLFFFLPILCTRFLENESTDLHEIFRTDENL